MREAAITLDTRTLLVVATCVVSLLGLFLLSAWRQDRTRAMLWWSMAYMVGGIGLALWAMGGLVALPLGLPNAFIFFACGMIWNAARLFHGRPVSWVGLCAGAIVWLLAGPLFDAAVARAALSALIIAVYTFLTAVELWRERRKTLPKRWPAQFVPMLHGAVFLLPLLAGLAPGEDGTITLANGWVELFAMETLLYAVGTAFMIVVLSKERQVYLHKTAASTDPLTGLFNRRAFFDGAASLIARQARKGEPVCVLAFDLDHFKSINDRFGHALGDEALRVFAATVSGNMRANDLVARLGGEEFAAIVPGGVETAKVVAERVRGAFQTAGRELAGRAVGVTVSIGVATAAPGTDIHALLGWADYALYRAKSNGRNRVEAAVSDVPHGAPPPCPGPAATSQGVAAAAA